MAQDIELAGVSQRGRNRLTPAASVILAGFFGQKVFWQEVFSASARLG
jgi:hypothetical protein